MNLRKAKKNYYLTIVEDEMGAFVLNCSRITHLTSMKSNFLVVCDIILVEMLVKWTRSFKICRMGRPW